MLSVTLVMLIILNHSAYDEHKPPDCKEAQGLANGKNTEFILVRMPFKDRNDRYLWMRPEAAEEFADMIEMAISHGYEIKLNSAYRTYEHQLSLWKRMPPGVAAHPKKGGTHTHQTGLSIDIAGTTREWEGEQRETLLYWFLKRFARKFQFYNDVPTEPWHWTYMGPLKEENKMCGKLDWDNAKIPRGGKVHVQMKDGSQRMARWSGHAREENLDSTWKGRGEECVIKVDGFVEKDTTFSVPEDHGLEGFALKENGQVLIVTRESRTPTERAAHHRHPKVVPVRRRTMLRRKPQA